MLHFVYHSNHTSVVWLSTTLALLFKPLPGLQSILFALFVVVLMVTSSVEAGRRRRQLDAMPTVYRARLRRPSVTGNAVRQQSGRPPLRYHAYISGSAGRPGVIRAARPMINNHRRYMKFDYEHPDHYHIYHS